MHGVVPSSKDRHKDSTVAVVLLVACVDVAASCIETWEAR